VTRSAGARIRSRRCIARDVTRGAVADAYGTGPTAAGLGAAALEEWREAVVSG
jgi:hypothetical protein